MDERTQSVNESGWICNLCGVPVEVETVRLQYRRTIFALHLPTCPQCGMILIDEELAVGKMAEAEQIIEDK
jgi:rubrerythrin